MAPPYKYGEKMYNYTLRMRLPQIAWMRDKGADLVREFIDARMAEDAEKAKRKAKK